MRRGGLREAVVARRKLRRSELPKYTIIDVEGRWQDTADEWQWWPRVLWIDPGVVSGVACIWFDPKAVFGDLPMARQLLAVSQMYLSGPENGLNGQINRFMRIRRPLAEHPGLATGTESFTIRKFSADPDFLSPVRIRAGIEARLSVLGPDEEGVPLYHQSPSDAMNVFTNDRLKALGLYHPGPDHINDVTRHALLWIRKIRQAGREAFEAAHGAEEGWWQ